jgi:HAD superfamily hydrolase (TIGR01490 family)
VPGAAFFDLDRTLLRRSSALALAGAFRDRGLISRGQLAKAALWQLLFVARGADAETVRRAAEGGLVVLRGFRPADMRRLVADALEPVLRPLVYREPLALVERHRSRGESVYIVSAALQEIVDAIAVDLEFDGALGTICEVSDGVYTGRSLRALHGEAKADAVRELAHREGIDLSTSTAYSDSETDLPFLEAVGIPIAANPDRGLRRVARERGWEVLEFSERAYPAVKRPVRVSGPGEGVRANREVPPSSEARLLCWPILVGVPVVLGAAALAYRRRAA